MTSFDKRPRGRNNRRNGRRNYGSRSSQVIKLNDQGRAFNQQRVKFNGNASKLYEKYKKLAAEALSIGDKILAESYFSMQIISRVCYQYKLRQITHLKEN